MPLFQIQDRPKRGLSEQEATSTPAASPDSSYCRRHRRPNRTRRPAKTPPMAAHLPRVLGQETKSRPGAPHTKAPPRPGRTRPTGTWKTRQTARYKMGPSSRATNLLQRSTNMQRSRAATFSLFVFFLFLQNLQKKCEIAKALKSHKMYKQMCSFTRCCSYSMSSTRTTTDFKHTE